MADDIRRVELDLAYHSEKQVEIFRSEVRWVVVPCGRRYGKTAGAFRKLLELAVGKTCKLMWVDTTQGNIERYFGVYLEPLLKPLDGLYKWNKQQKVLTLWNGTIAHFGSSDQPQNLEGFGYDAIFLNEAGHILAGPKGERLWSNTILPMALEGRGGRGAQVFFLGTPKDIQYGPGLFRKMAQRGQDPNDTDVITFRRSTYDNPYMNAAMVREMVESGEVKPNEVRQEIYGEFEDQAGRNMVINYQLAMDALSREVPEGEEYHDYWGLDVARGGVDDTALAKRRHRRLREPVKVRGDLKDGNEVADWVENEFHKTPQEDRPRWIMVDEIGYGASALDALRKKGLPARGVNVSKSPVEVDRFFRKRDELWFRGAKWLETGNIAGDDALLRELALVAYGYQPNTDKLKVESKDELKKLGHASPNRADAFLLTMDAGNELRDTRGFAQRLRNWRQPQTTWMSA